MNRLSIGIALVLFSGTANVAMAQGRPRPKADFEAKAGNARPIEKGARWEHPQPTPYKVEPVRMEPKKDAQGRSNEKDNWDRGRVADRVYPDAKWSGGQHTRRFNDAAKQPTKPESTGGRGDGKGDLKGAAGPMKKGDLSKEFKKAADPPKKTDFDKPQKNYDPPKPTGPGSSGPKPPSPK